MAIPPLTLMCKLCILVNGVAGGGPFFTYFTYFCVKCEFSSCIYQKNVVTLQPLSI